MFSISTIQLKIIGLLAITLTITGLYFYVNHIKNELETKKIEVVTLQTAINLQNSMLEQANKERATTQVLLDAAVKKNKTLSYSFNKIKEEIIAAPTLNTCDQAFDNIKDFGITISKEWNVQ